MRILTLLVLAFVLIACGANAEVPQENVIIQTPVAASSTPEPASTSTTPPTQETMSPEALPTDTPGPAAGTPTPAWTATITPTNTIYPATAEVINIMYLDNGELMIVLDLEGRPVPSFYADLDGREFAWCPRLPNQRDRITCIGDPPRGIRTAHLTIRGTGGQFHAEEITIPEPPD